MTIVEFEEFFYSKNIKPASLLFQGEPKNRFNQIREYLDKGTSPRYDYSDLEEYCKTPGGLVADERHLNESSNMLRHIVCQNEQEEKVVAIYRDKINFRLQERELIEAAYKNLGSHSDEVFRLSEKMYGKLNKEIYQRYLENIENLSNFDSLLNGYYKVTHSEFSIYFETAKKYGSLDIINAETATKLANDILKQLRYTNWTAVQSESSSSVRIMQSLKELWIPVTYERNLHETIKLLIHEIGVHIARRENGSDHKYMLFSDGTRLDNLIEEGTSIFIEAIIDAKSHTLPTALYRAAYRYLALIYALQLDGKSRSTVKDVYDDLVLHNNAHGTHVSEQSLIEVIDNIYRGTNFENPKNVFLRAKVYLEGFLKVSEYIKNHNPSVEVLDSLLVARYDFTDSEEVELLKVI